MFIREAMRERIHLKLAVGPTVITAPDQLDALLNAVGTRIRNELQRPIRLNRCVACGSISVRGIRHLSSLESTVTIHVPRVSSQATFASLLGMHRPVFSQKYISSSAQYPMHPLRPMGFMSFGQACPV